MSRTMLFLRRFLLVLGCFAIAAGVTARLTHAAERRVALIVGVGAYRKVPALRNTLNDARGIDAALRRLGFEVDTVLDPDRPALEAAMRRFGSSARGADVALFFYAGHALEAAGRNWLLPVSADIHNERDLRFEAIELDGVLEQLEGAARASIILLDACRDNPFRARLGAGRGLDAGGLARVQAAVGTLISFSTAPGTVAEDGAGTNSPFTTALMKRIETPGLEIRQMLDAVRHDVREATRGRQVPWEQSAMEGSLYLKSSPAVPIAPSARPFLDADPLFWDSVRTSTNPADFKAYLARFPDGLFAELARIRLATIAAPAIPPLRARLAAVMAQLAPSEATVVPDRYVADAESKALALSPDRHQTYRTFGWSTPAIAEERGLEGCQTLYGSPCMLLALNAQMSPGAVDRPLRDMPRVRYAGPYDPAQIPALSEVRRSNPVVAGYGAALGPKAMAFHPWGRVFSATAASSQRTAEEQALAACNADPDRHGRDGPCYLYASAERVVLPQRLTQPRP